MLLTVIVCTLCTDSQKNVQKSQDHGYTFDQLFIEWFKCMYTEVIQMDNCLICEHKVLNHAQKLHCSFCLYHYHLKCITLDYRQQEHLMKSKSNWFCCKCNESLFPFNLIEDDEDFHWALHPREYCKFAWGKVNGMLFNPLDPDDNIMNSPLSDVDHDINYFNELQFHENTNCNYLLEDKWKTLIDTVGCKANEDVFAFNHLNIEAFPRILPPLQLTWKPSALISHLLELLKHGRLIITVTCILCQVIHLSKSIDKIKLGEELAYL